MTDLPELFGFEYFKAALDVKDSHTSIDPALISLLEASGGEEILDYGCGSGTISDKLAKLGKRVTAYDIDNQAFNSKGPHRKGVSFVDRNGLDQIIEDGKTFDCIVCNLVICTIEDDNEALRVLKGCRRLLSARGSLILGICNPFDIFTTESTGNLKELPSGADYHAKFVYRKQSKKTGRWREDVHRSLGWYKSAFRKAGLQLDELKETPSMDIRLLCPSSDFMLMKLRPVSIQESNVSLLIKAGTMEWRTIRRQIEHIVSRARRASKIS